MPHLPPLKDWIPLLKEVIPMVRIHPLSNMGCQSRTRPGGWSSVGVYGTARELRVIFPDLQHCTIVSSV